MSDCQCSSMPFPDPPCEQEPSQISTFPECDNIRMFFGYELPSVDQASPGKLKQLYYTGPVSIDDSKRGFIINKYSFQELVDSGILPSDPNNANICRLTEAELLSTITYESWISYNIMQFCMIQQATIANNVLQNADGYFNFAYACFRLLDYNFNEVLNKGFRTLSNLLNNGDTSSFFSEFLKLTAAPGPKAFNTPKSFYQLIIDWFTPDCNLLKQGQVAEKLYLCYEWIKNIHDTYYGKQFLVKISPPPEYLQGEQSESGADNYLKNRLGVCISDTSSPSGNIPDIVLNAMYGYDPCFIDGDGSNQGFYVSDEISGDGGFLHQTDLNLIGLKNLTPVINESGKIDSFVRVGFFNDPPPQDQPIGCEITNLTKYKKFEFKTTNNGNSCRDWTIDITKIDPSNVILEKEEIADDYIYETLYTKCSFESRFYIDGYGTWVQFTLNDKIPLKLEGADLNQAFVNFAALLSMSDQIVASYGIPTNTQFVDGVTKPNNVTSVNKFSGVSPWDFLTPFFKLKPKTKPEVLGSLSNTHQLNLATCHPPCLIPQGVVIPFKSNVYKYGPYYNLLTTGPLVETIIEENLVPWNFIDISGITQGCFCCSLTNAYETMHNYGRELVTASAKKLEKLEKAKITVAGLPCYCLGHSVDTVDCVNTTGAIGPTLLTDMNVEYGSGGFNTTYNFSTYSPRLGRPEKYIRDMWSDKIKLFQTRNKFRLEQKNKLLRLNQQFKFRNISGAKGGGGRDLFPGRNIFRNDSTANKLLFSGYYLNQDPFYEDPVYNYTQYPSVSGINQDDPSCKDIICTPTHFNPIPVSGIKTPNRLYNFADIDKAYSSEYIQNTYYQLAGMSFDGLFLPVSLRGVNSDPVNAEYQRVDPATNRSYIFINNRLVINPNWTNSGKLPRFSMRCENNGQFIEWDQPGTFDSSKTNNAGMPISSKTRDEIPPFRLIKEEFGYFYAYNLQINQRYLNPLLSTKNLIGNTGNDTVVGWDDRRNNTNKGFVISSIVFGQDHDEYQISHLNPACDAELYGADPKRTDEYIRQEYKNFRVPALRGPLILQGWGYDTSGKPIPNLSDDYKHAELGQFRKDKLSDKFLENWIQNPKTWPVGPVDLRFDRERGVWTCPSPNKIVVARLKESLSPYSLARAELLNPSAANVRFYQNYGIWGPNGEDIKLSLSAAEITVFDYLGISLCACDTVYAYYDDNKYIVLESSRGYKDPNQECDTILCTTPTTTTTPPCSWYGHDSLKEVPNYNHWAKQILGHDENGCLIWYDITTCGETPSPAPLIDMVVME